MRDTWLQIAETSSARIYNLIVGVIALFITARILGPEGRGIIAASTAWVSLTAVCAGLSLGQVLQYEVKLKKLEEWLPQTLGLLLTSALVLTVLAYAVVIVIYFISNGAVFKGIHQDVLTVSFLMLPLIIWEDYSSSLLTAANKLRFYNVMQFVGRSVWLAMLLLFLLVVGWGLISVFIAQIIGQLIIAVGTLVMLIKLAGNKVCLSDFGLKNFFRGSTQLHLNTISSLVLMQTSILILNHFSTKSDVGNYQLAYQIIMILLIIPQAVSMILFSRMNQLGPDKLWAQQKKLLLQTMILIVVLAGISYLIVPLMIIALAGPSFSPSIDMFHLMLPNILGLTFAQVMTCQWIGRGYFYQTTIVTTTTAIINLVACFVLIPKYGVLGAIWSGWIVYIGITMIVQGIFAWRCNNEFVKT